MTLRRSVIPPLTFGQNASNDYSQNTASGYPSANTYGVTGQQQQPQTAYGQYNQYGTAQTATPYQYPTQPQYGAYGQTTQYNQPTAGQPVGQSAVQPSVPVIQPVIQAVGSGQPSVQPQGNIYNSRYLCI